MSAQGMPTQGMSSHALQVNEPLTTGLELEKLQAVSYLRDSTGQDDLDEVIRKDKAGQFKAMPPNWVAGYTTDAIWIKFTLAFPSHGIAPYWLEISPAILDDIQLYVPTGATQYQLQRLGDHQPASARPITHRNFVFPLHPLLDDQPHTFYARVKSTGVINFHATLWQPAAFIAQHSRPDSLIGAYYGIRLFLAMFAVILWLWLRHQIFFWYAFYQCVVCSVQAYFAGTAQIMWPMEPLLADAMQKSLNFLYTATALWFYAALFDLKSHYPRTLRVIHGLAIINTALFLAVVTRVMEYPATWVNLLYLCGMLLLLGISIRILRDRRYGNVLFIASLWVNGMPILPAILKNLGVPWAPSITIMDNLILWPLISLVLVTLGMVKFAKNEAEKKLLDKDLALRNSQESERLLDQRVSERTQQLEQSNHRLKLEIAERETLHLQLQGALTRKRELMAAQRQFFAMASHEFRTPLAIIDATAQRLALSHELEAGKVAESEKAAAAEKIAKSKNFNEAEKASEPERASELAQPTALSENASNTLSAMTKIRRATLRMSRMIDNFLNTDKLELVNVPDAITLELIDVRQLILANAEHYRSLTNHSINLDLPDHAVMVLCDPYMINLVISNLIDNAIKYSPMGTALEIALKELKGQAKIQVRDAGHGIAADQLEKIFEKYFRLGENKHIQGTGLGLHVSRKIAESHDGSLTVSSEVGIGSTFVFSLPISESGFSE